MAYVVEQIHMGRHVYWDGCEIPTSGRHSVNRWTKDYSSAVKFTDRESATKVLVSLCDGIGAVVEHGFVGEFGE